MTLETTRVGSYALLLELAAGGMATVYVARQLGGAGFERLVVIKRVHAHLLKDSAFTDMFRDEARLSSTIRHPNVVPVIDVVDTGGELLLVLEYIESVSLSVLARIAQTHGTPLAPAIVSRIVSDALSGLHAAHEAVDLRGKKLDLIHRDVSPQNVIVGTDGTSRLIDFGIAKAASRITTTTNGVLKGKVRYMSPEQVRQKPLDRRADVFAAGVVLYEALTGELPFPGDDAGDVAMGILLGAPSPPTAVVPSLPPAIDAVVLRALASQRDERYETARELQEALELAIPPATPRDVANVVGMLAASLFEKRRAELQAALDAISTAPTSIDVAEVPTEASSPSASPTSRRRWLGIALAGGTATLISAALFIQRAETSPAAPTSSFTTASTVTRDEPLSAPVPAPSVSTSTSSLPAGTPQAESPSAPKITTTSASAPRPAAPPARKGDRGRPAPSSDLLRKNPYAVP